ARVVAQNQRIELRVLTRRDRDAARSANGFETVLGAEHHAARTLEARAGEEGLEQHARADDLLGLHIETVAPQGGRRGLGKFGGVVGDDEEGLASGLDAANEFGRSGKGRRRVYEDAKGVE